MTDSPYSSGSLIPGELPPVIDEQREKLNRLVDDTIEAGGANALHLVTVLDQQLTLNDRFRMAALSVLTQFELDHPEAHGSPEHVAKQGTVAAAEELVAIVKDCRARIEEYVE